MAVTIQVKRGNNASVPALATGEFGLATDTNNLYIGGSSENLQIAMLGSSGQLPASQIPALPYDPAGAAQVVIRDATITSGLIILTDASNIDSGSIIKVYAPSNSQSVTQGISIDNTAYPIFDSNGETINGEANIWTEGAALSLLIDKQNEVAYLLNSISPGGFIESTQSIPTAQRSSNALYGLILADFGGGN